MNDVIIFSNTRGFQQEKKIQINNFVGRHKPLVFLVAEHFQSSAQELQLNGYELARCYCRFSRERGGVAVFVRLGEKYTTRRDLDGLNVKKEFEVRSIELPSRNMVVTVLYRPPSGRLPRFYDNLEKMLKIFRQSPYQKHVLAGDFNIDNGASNKTEQILARYNFNFTCTSKTHELGGCLDNFVVDFIPSTTRVMKEKLSDHHCIQLIIPCGTDKKLLDVGNKIWPIQVAKPLPEGNSSEEDYTRRPFPPRNRTVLSPRCVPQLHENQYSANLIHEGINPNFHIADTFPDIRNIKYDLSDYNNAENPIAHSVLYPTNQVSIQASSSSYLRDQLPLSDLIHFDQNVSGDCEPFSTNSEVEGLSKSLDEANEQIHNLKQKVLFLETKFYNLERKFAEMEKRSMRNSVLLDSDSDI